VNNRGVGLLAIWASAIVAMITLYLVFQLITPIIGQFDYAIQDYMLTSPLPITASWSQLFTDVGGFMQQAFSITIYACFISLIVFIVVQSARRRTDAYDEDEL